MPLLLELRYIQASRRFYHWLQGFHATAAGPVRINFTEVSRMNPPVRHASHCAAYLLRSGEHRCGRRCRRCTTQAPAPLRVDPGLLGRSSHQKRRRPRRLRRLRRGRSGRRCGRRSLPDERAETTVAGPEPPAAPPEKVKKKPGQVCSGVARRRFRRGLLRRRALRRRLREPLSLPRRRARAEGSDGSRSRVTLRPQTKESETTSRICSDTGATAGEADRSGGCHAKGRCAGTRGVVRGSSVRSGCSPDSVRTRARDGVVRRTAARRSGAARPIAASGDESCVIAEIDCRRGPAGCANHDNIATGQDGCGGHRFGNE